MKLAPNVVIAGRFRLNKLLGRGGMGSVWHATHLGLDIPCAVKFIEGEQAQSAEAQARFEREAKAAAQLRSPHVVQILDHGISDGTPYIAMELLDGEDLGKRMAGAKRMDPKELVPIVTQVCRALSRAHALGVVHRDLKPDNVFLVRDDDREIAKVVDFGIAKHSNKLEGSSTKTGAMLGTPFFMSPEQAQGTKAVDHRSDLWSLAVIVYQAVVGKLPFVSEALGDLLVKIIVSPIPVPSHHAPDVPAAFDKWWAKAASRDPDQRFQTAKEFAEALQIACGTSQMTELMDRTSVGEVAQARPPMGSVPEQVDEQDEASLVELVSATPAGMGRTFNGSEVHSRPTKRSASPMLAGLLLASCLGIGTVIVVMKTRGGPANAVANSPLPEASIGVDRGGAESVTPPASASAASARAEGVPPATEAPTIALPKPSVSPQRGVVAGKKLGKPPPFVAVPSVKPPETFTPPIEPVTPPPVTPLPVTPPPVTPPVQTAPAKPPVDPCQGDVFCGHTRVRPQNRNNVP